MLKALELSGFKSFADRTRFDFPPGISIVVGPNGSGKSNVVDAVKWVLGSQSAKSLRGKEMTDVIFNGCPTRSPMGTSEVTLTLDNADRRLAIEANEVHVARRVYRSGEGEYLINRQPCRLKDVRELLAATGMTTEAYCIIEQGKVDALLQSSPRDRRVIFEEAAGISQFKAKKAVAQRRMERVEQNLLRLSDIVDEVEARLRTIRSQAGKARKYRECTERLQQLRTEVALVDWRQFTKQIEGRQRQIADVKCRVDERTAAIEKHETAAQDLEQKLQAGAEETRRIEADASAAREQIAALQATLESQRARQVELQNEVAQLREQLVAVDTQDSGAGDAFHDATEKLQAAEAELANVAAECAAKSEQAQRAHLELSEALSRHGELRTKLDDSIRSAAIANDQIATLESEVIEAAANSERLRALFADLAARHDSQSAEFERDQKTEAALTVDTENHQAALAAAERRLVDVRRDLAKADALHRRLDAQLTRVHERIAVLSELESRLEGLDGGVQEILRLARENDTLAIGDVRGVIADLFHVDVDSAPLVEVALGERAQYIVLGTVGALLERLHVQPLRVAGRVGFLGLDARPASTALDHVDLSAEPGVMGRAEQFVETAPEYQILTRRLLGRTWLVDRVSTALRLAQSVGRGLEFVTSDGELVAADGTIVVGPRQAATGVLSRRSELRACHEQARELETQLLDQEASRSQLDAERANQEQLVASSIAAYTLASGKLTECHRKTAAASAQLDRLGEQQRHVQTDLERLRDHIVRNRAEIQRSAAECAALEFTAAQLETAVNESQQRLVALEAADSESQAAATEQKIAVARCQQCVEMLCQQLEQVQRTRQDRDQILSEMRERLSSREAMALEINQALHSGGQSLAELHQAKELHSKSLAVRKAEEDDLRRGRNDILERIRTDRQELTTLQAHLHKLEVTVTRLNHERRTLCERMQEDYGINLEQAADSQSAESLIQSSAASSQSLAPQREAVEREIAELREQLNNIGAINLEALDELEQLEARFEKLSAQYRDLVDAKATLERITQRINVDSRQLFLTTVETVRGHFQELFRRLFGGGEADIIVDENEDVLECGIEIVARPPGKEACSISLLSGGEKTLTCVALLLAVFRSKPSPFCILDEVDAALDEANIGRFTAVLKEFLSFTQFIVISHSKKTMAGADTLYGVTMEESGVSKRVSVRFEDVSEDGQILPSAIFHARQIEQATEANASEQASERRRAA